MTTESVRLPMARTLPARHAWVTTRRVAVAALALLMLLNVVNYSSLRLLPGGAFIGYLRFPVLLLALFVLLHQFRGRLSVLFAENYDVLLFVAWTAIASLLSWNPLVSFAYSAWLGSTLAFLLVVMHCFTDVRSMIERVDQALLIAYAMPVVLGVTAIPTYLTGGLRLAGDLDIKQTFAWAAVLVMAAMVSIASIARARGRRSLLGWGPASMTVLGICVVSIIFSGNRGSVGGLAGLVGVYLLSRDARHSAGAKYAVGLLIGILIAQAYVQSFTANRYRTFFEQESLSTSDQLRARIYRANLAYGLQHPVFGGGLSTAAVQVAASIPNAPPHYAAHSTYLEIVSETGIAGFGIFLLVIARSAWLLWREPRWRSARVYVIMLAVPVLLMSATESDLTPGQMLFFPLWISILLARGANPRVFGSSRV